MRRFGSLKPAGQGKQVEEPLFAATVPASQDLHSNLEFTGSLEYCPSVFFSRV